MHSIGLRGDSITLLVSGGIGIVQLLAVLPAIVYIDRWGKTCVASALDEAHVVCREETTFERFFFFNMAGSILTFVSPGGAAIMATAHLIIAMLVRVMSSFRSLPRANEGCQVSMFEDELATYPAAAWIAVG